MVVLY